MDVNNFNIFSPYSEAVIAIKDGKTVYLNDAAKKLFGENGPKAEDFSPLFFGGGEDCIAGTVTVDGVDHAASAVKWFDCTVITVFRTKPTYGESISKMMNLFLGRIASELSVIQMGMGLIKDEFRDVRDGKLQQYGSMMQHSYNKLLRLVNNASRMYMWSGREDELTISCFDIVELAAKLVDSVNYLTDDRLKISFSAQSSEYLFFGDAEKIETMLLNLLSNAIKYTPKDGKIQVKIECIPKGLLLSVSDTGRGIKSDILGSVFSKYNEDMQTDDTMAGVGLGLPLVQKIAMMHGGSAVLESREGEGTLVKVFMPDRKYEDMLRDTGVSYQSSMRNIMIELSDVIDHDKYVQHNLE